MGTTRRFSRTPDDRKRLHLDIPMPDGGEVTFTFNTRVTLEMGRQVQALEQGEDLEAMPRFLKGRIVSTSSANKPEDDFDAADLDLPEMQNLLKEIMVNGGMDLGESSPSPTPSSDDEGNSSSTSSTSTDSTSTTSASEPTPTGSFT